MNQKKKTQGTRAHYRRICTIYFHPMKIRNSSTLPLHGNIYMYTYIHIFSTYLRITTSTFITRKTIKSHTCSLQPFVIFSVVFMTNELIPSLRLRFPRIIIHKIIQIFGENNRETTQMVSCWLQHYSLIWNTGNLIYLWKSTVMQQAMTCAWEPIYFTL